MLELLSDKWWATIGQYAESATTKRAAVAYVSSAQTIVFGEGDLLIVDASDHAIKTGQTSARVLRAALRRKAELYSFAGLHAKVIVLDGTVFIGSANISEASKTRLVEMGIMSDQPALVAQARGFLDALRRKSEPIDEKFIERIMALPVTPRRYGPKRTGSITVRKPVTWIVGLIDLDEDRYPAEQKRAEAGRKIAEKALTNKDGEVSWARMSLKSRFGQFAKKGDQLIEVHRTTQNGRPTVYPATPILHRQSEPNCNRIYYAMQRDDATVTLADLQAMLRAAGVRRKLTKRPARALTAMQADAVSALWKEYAG